MRLLRRFSRAIDADYPRELLDVVVIADNCTDATGGRAEQAGARCLTRHAPATPGKGPALTWAFDQLLATDADAFLVMDADCRLERDTLRIVDHFLQDGDRVLQTNHRVTNADASPISYAAAVGRTLEYDLFFAPKSRLGLAVLLVGTGMVFQRSVLAGVSLDLAFVCRRYRVYDCVDTSRTAHSLSRQRPHSLRRS